MKDYDFFAERHVILKGRASGILRRVYDNKGSFTLSPPKEIMRSAGLTPNTLYETIILKEGGIAIIPIKDD